MKIKRYQKWAWYGLYAVVCAAVLLVWRFPANDLAIYIEALVAHKSPQSLLSISNLKPTYPLGVIIKHVELDQTMPKGKLNLLIADNFSVKAEPLSLLRRHYNFHLKGDLYRGEALGFLGIDESGADSIKSELHLQGIHIEEVKLLAALAGVELRAALSGDIFYEGRLSSLLDGTGVADFKVGAGRVSLVKPLFGFTETLGIEKTELSFSLNKRQVQTNIIFTGTELFVELHGNINLREDLLQSSLNLTGKITGTTKFLSKGGQTSGPGMTIMKKGLQAGPISFSLLGSVAKPNVRLR